MIKNILFIIPHPDDEIVGASKIIRKFIKQKKNIIIFFLTNGIISKNSMWIWKRKNYEHYLSVRLDEMKSSMNQLGINKYFFQNIPSRTLKDNIKNTYKKIQKIINNQKIDTIFCPSYEGGHQDHDVANFICSRFKNVKSIFEFAEYNFFNKKINSNLFFNNTNKETILKLSKNDKEFKIKCLKIYDSEKNNLNYVNISQEVFRKLPKHNYNEPPHNGTLFYRRFSFFSWHPRVDSDSPNDVCKKIIRSKLY